MKSYKFLIVGAFSFLSLFSCGENKTNPFCYKIGNGELFKVLNLTDVQLDYAGQLKDDITIKPTIDKMIKKLKPTIVTLSGDYGWKAGPGMGKEEILQCVGEICECLENYNINYYFVYGNHDREKAKDYELANVINSYKHGHIERGIELNNTYGNYTIEIQNQYAQPIHAIYMMDSRDYFPDKTVDQSKVEFRRGSQIINNVKYNHIVHGKTDTDCIVNDVRYDCIHQEQADWYDSEVERLNKCESTIITHMPINGFTYAFENYVDAINKKEYERIKSYKPIGPCRQEETCSGGVYDGAIYNSIQKYGSTKNVIVGHDHINDFSLLYKDVRFTYAVKTGDGCYWKNDGSMNGATLLTINDKGVGKVSQHYWNPFTNQEIDYYEPV